MLFEALKTSNLIHVVMTCCVWGGPEYTIAAILNKLQLKKTVVT